MKLDNFGNLPFNWFDLLIVIVLVLGVMRGRKRGMSEELIGTLMWVAIAFGCAFTYEPVGTMIAQSAVFNLLTGFIMAYIGGALLLVCGFLMMKKAVGGKLVGSDIFGQSEFYLGMMAGMMRFACILIAAIALLNARYYNPVEIKNNLQLQNELYGSNFFPTLYEVQAQVFEKSWTGPWIKDQLAFLLIKPTAPETKQLKQKEFAVP